MVKPPVNKRFLRRSGGNFEYYLEVL
jgi:hypothetical protein